MICPNCKKQIYDDSQFCEYCGAKIEKSNKGLWITLGVIALFALVGCSVYMYNVQQESLRIERKRLEEENRRAAERQAELEAQLEEERIAKEKAEQARRVAEQKAKEEAEQARRAAEQKAKAEAEKARREAEQKAKAEAEARKEAERIAKAEAEKAHMEAEKKSKAEAEQNRKKELRRQGYVDLGLPSGTWWKNENEGGRSVRYTLYDAVNRFGNKLPSKKQFQELIDYCTWVWVGVGYNVYGPNGKFIYLPAAGYGSKPSKAYGENKTGAYWAYNMVFYRSDKCGYALWFSSKSKEISFSCEENRLSVRLVQELK